MPKIASRRSLALIGCVLVLAGAGAWLASVRARSADAHGDAAFVAARREAMDRFEDLPLGTLDRRAVERGLAAGSYAGATADRALVSSLARDCAEFLANRFIDASPHDYIAWRERLGYQRHSMDHLTGFWRVDTVHQAFFGKPLPTDSWEGAFAAMWPGAGPQARPVSLGSAPEAFSAAIARYSGADPEWPDLPGVVGEAIRYSGSIGTSHPWWMHPHGLNGQLDAQGAATVGVVGLTLGFADGTRKPVAIAFVWHPAERRWLVETVTMGRNGVRWDY